MTTVVYKSCLGLLAWRQISGLLVKNESGMFEARCTVCGAVLFRSSPPKHQNMKCHRKSVSRIRP